MNNFNEKLTELSFGEENSKFPSEDDIELDDAISKALDDTKDDVKDEPEDIETSIEKTEESKDDKKVVDKKIEIETTEDETEYDDGNVFKEFAATIKNDLFPNLSEDEFNNIKNVDDIKAAIQNGVNNTLTNFKDAYKKQLLNNLKADGILNNTSSSNPYLYEKEDLLDSVDKQEQVIRSYYQEKGIDDDMIDSIINSSIDLEKDSLGVLDKLKEIASNKVSRQEQETASKISAFEEGLITNISKNKDFVPGYSLNKEQEVEILNDIPKVLETINADLITYAPRIAILKAAGILDGDFNKIILKAENNSNKKFKDILTKNKTLSKSRNNNFKTDFEIDNSDTKKWYR